MTTTSLPLASAARRTARPEPKVRQTKRQRIVNFFTQNLGKRYGSQNLHGMFGTSFRSRVSEINRDQASAIRIQNETTSRDDGEPTVYWAELRPTAESLFGDLGPDRTYKA